MLCPTQWNLFASKRCWNNFNSAFPMLREKMDERMTATWRRLNEYWPQSSITMLWSFRLMYAELTSWGPSDSKSSVQPERARKALNFKSTRNSFDASTKRTYRGYTKPFYVSNQIDDDLLRSRGCLACSGCCCAAKFYSRDFESDRREHAGDYHFHHINNSELTREQKWIEYHCRFQTVSQHGRLAQ